MPVYGNGRIWSYAALRSLGGHSVCTGDKPVNVYPPISVSTYEVGTIKIWCDPYISFSAAGYACAILQMLHFCIHFAHVFKNKLIRSILMLIKLLFH